MDREKVVIGIPMGQEPEREDQQFFPAVTKEASQAVEALCEGNRIEAYKHVGILGFLLGQRMAR